MTESALAYTSTDARQHLKDVLVAAETGHPVSVDRAGHRSAVVSADRLRKYLALTCDPAPRIAFEEDGCVVFMEDRPFVAEGRTIDEALAELVTVLREYAEDWTERLQYAPDHHEEWGLVQLVGLSTDEQLIQWLRDAR